VIEKEVSKLLRGPGSPRLNHYLLKTGPLVGGYFALFLATIGARPDSQNPLGRIAGPALVRTGAPATVFAHAILVGFTGCEDFYRQGLDLADVKGWKTATGNDDDLEFSHFLEATERLHVIYCGLSMDKLSTTNGVRGKRTYLWQANLA